MLTLHVIGGDTGTRYRIHDGRTLNIAQLNESGGRERLLCFEPGGTLPVGDAMLAQKTALELFEVKGRSGWRTPHRGMGDWAGAPPGKSLRRAPSVAPSRTPQMRLMAAL